MKISKRKNDETKSIILAPYNSYIEQQNNVLDSNIKIENNILEFDSKTQPLNENYESNNNYEFNNDYKVDDDLMKDINKKVFQIKTIIIQFMKI